MPSQIDRRFSSLFIQPPPIEIDGTVMTGALPDPSLSGKNRTLSFRRFCKKLLGRQISDPLVKSTDGSRFHQELWSGLVVDGNATWNLISSASNKTTATIEKTTATQLPDFLRNARLAESSASIDSAFSTKSSPSRPSSLTYTIPYRSLPASMRRKRTVTPDPKYSSKTSLPALNTSFPVPSPRHSLTTGHVITLNVEEMAVLQSLVRRIGRQLKKQEHLSSHLAGNLFHIFSRKEAMVAGLKRCRVQEREAAGREIFRVKETVERGFLRRVVLAGRSEGAMNVLRSALEQSALEQSALEQSALEQSALEQSAKGPSTTNVTMKRLERSPSRSSLRSAALTEKHSYGPVLSALSSSSSTTTSPRSSISDISASTSATTIVSTSTIISPKSTSSTARSPIITLSPSSPLSFTMPVQILQQTCQSLLTNLSLHSILNAEIKNTIHTAYLGSRWNGRPGGAFGRGGARNNNDKITMQRFLSFVDDRVGKIEETGRVLEILVQNVESLAKAG